MTRSRISMVVAAAGLVLVGLLAAALFSPSQDEPKDETTAKDDEDIKPVKPKTAKVENPLYETDTVFELPDGTETNSSAETDDADDGDSAESEESKASKAEETKKGGIIEHTIKPGDMISKLAVKYGCKSSDIYKVNDGLTKDNAHKIRVGQVIRVPVNGEGVDTVEKSDSGSNGTAASTSSDGEYFPRRVITAEPRDNAFSLAVEHYGAKSMFRRIIRSNPDIDWTNPLSGGEQVLLPEVGTPTGKAPASGDTVERDSLIPPRR